MVARKYQAIAGKSNTHFAVGEKKTVMFEFRAGTEKMDGLFESATDEPL